MVQNLSDVEYDGGDRLAQLALAGLEAAIGLVDNIGTAATADHAVVPVTALERLERVADLHGSQPSKNLA